jgi:quinol monooxygenase YgiN
MMVRILRICIVDPEPTKTQAFLSAHSSGGLWSLLARKYYPVGFLGVQTFRSRKTPSIFALIEYWTSAECLEVARRTPAYPVLKRFQRNLAISTIDCGVVRVPVFETEDRLDTPVTAQAGTAARVTTPCAATVESEAILLSEFTNHPHLWARFKFLEALYEINALALHHDLSLLRRVP